MHINYYIFTLFDLSKLLFSAGLLSLNYFACFSNLYLLTFSHCSSHGDTCSIMKQWVSKSCVFCWQIDAVWSRLNSMTQWHTGGANGQRWHDSEKLMNCGTFDLKGIREFPFKVEPFRKTSPLGLKQILKQWGWTGRLEVRVKLPSFSSQSSFAGFWKGFCALIVMIGVYIFKWETRGNLCELQTTLMLIFWQKDFKKQM